MVKFEVKHESYANGGVQRGFVTFPDGDQISLTYMKKGDHKFVTDKKEKIQILSGKLDVTIGSGRMGPFECGDEFNIPKNTTFHLSAIKAVKYICFYG